MKWSLLCCHLLERPSLPLLLFTVMKHVQMFMLQYMMQLGSIRVHLRVFHHPNVPSYLRTQPASLFRRHELEQKREYGDRIPCSVECTCGMGHLLLWYIYSSGILDFWCLGENQLSFIVALLTYCHGSMVPSARSTPYLS